MLRSHPITFFLGSVACHLIWGRSPTGQISITPPDLVQTFFFQMAGLKQAFLLTILKSVCGLTGVLVCIFLAQKFLGRRSMMLIGHGVPAALMLGIGIADTVASKSDGAGRAIV